MGQAAACLNNNLLRRSLHHSKPYYPLGRVACCNFLQTCMRLLHLLILSPGWAGAGRTLPREEQGGGHALAAPPYASNCHHVLPISL